MHVEAQQALTMVDPHTIAFEIERPRENHCSAVHGRNGRVRANAVIEPLMNALGDAIENPACAERVRGLGVYRSGKRTGPFPLGRDAAEHVMLEFLVSLDFFLLLGG